MVVRRARRPVARPARARPPSWCRPRRSAPGRRPSRSPTRTRPRRGIGPILVICLVTALLAGALGGTLGYVFAVRGGVGGPARPSARRRRDAAGRGPAAAGLARRGGRAGAAQRGHRAGAGTGGVSRLRLRGLRRRLRDHQRPRRRRTPATPCRWRSATAPPRRAAVVGQDPESDIAVIKVAKTGLPPVRVRRLRRDRGRRPGARVRLAAGPGQHGHRRHRQRPRPHHPGRRAGRHRSATTRRSRPTPRSTRATPAARWSTAAGRVVGVNSVIKSLVADDDRGRQHRPRLRHPDQPGQAGRPGHHRHRQGPAYGDRRRRSATPARAAAAASGCAAVEPAGPAAAAGLKAGDVVTKLDGRVLEERHRPDRAGPQVRAGRRRDGRVPPRHRHQADRLGDAWPPTPK